MDITTKITLYTILAIVASVSTLVYIDYAYASHYGDGVNHPTPTPMPHNASLKQQIQNNFASNLITCQNTQHILAERNNEKLACVTPYTMAKLDATPINESYYVVVEKNKVQFEIFAHLSETNNLESIKHDKDMNSILVHVTSDKTEKLSIIIDSNFLDYNDKDCKKIPGWSDFIVLINGEEVGFEERIITDDYRYLEIKVDMPIESGEYHSRGASEIHTYYDIPFEKDSMIIEIIGTCLI